MKGKAKTIILQVILTDSIDKVKKKIEIQEGIPVFELYMKENWSEKLHDSSKTLNDYGIQEGSTVYIDSNHYGGSCCAGIGCCIHTEEKTRDKVLGMKWVDVGNTKPPFLTEITDLITCPDAELLFCKMERERVEKWADLSEQKKKMYQKLFQDAKDRLSKLVDLVKDNAKKNIDTHVIDLAYDIGTRSRTNWMIATPSGPSPRGPTSTAATGTTPSASMRSHCVALSSHCVPRALAAEDEDIAAYESEGLWLSQNDCIKANGRYDDIIT
jgi:hypothetical protein